MLVSRLPPFCLKISRNVWPKKHAEMKNNQFYFWTFTFLEGKTKQWPLLCFCSVLEQHGLANKASIPTESFEKRFSRNLFLCLNSRHGKKSLQHEQWKFKKKTVWNKVLLWPFDLNFMNVFRLHFFPPLQVLRQRKLLAIAELIAEWKLLDVVVSFFFIVQETLFAKP